MFSGLLPPGPKDKLRAHCKLFGHEWTDEWQLLPSQFEMYKLCLRCSDYSIQDIREEARRRIAKAFGVKPIQWNIEHINCKSSIEVSNKERAT